MMPPPTWYSAARLTSPSSTIDAFAVVPPMSNVMSLPSPMRRASACAPTTPAAGPDSMMCIGCAAAATSVMRPPFDCMMRSGVFTPRAVEAGSQRGQVPADDRHHVGVDHRGRRPLVLADLRQHLEAVAGHQVRRAPAHQRLDLLLVRGVGVGVDQADGERLDALAAEPFERLLDLGEIERRLDSAAGVDALGHFAAQIALDERRPASPR